MVSGHLSNGKARFGICVTAFFSLSHSSVPARWRSDYYRDSPSTPVGSTLVWYYRTSQDVTKSSPIATLMISFAQVFAVCVGALTVPRATSAALSMTSYLFINIFLCYRTPLTVVIAAWSPGRVTTTLVLVVTGWAWGARVIRFKSWSSDNEIS